MDALVSGGFVFIGESDTAELPTRINEFRPDLIIMAGGTPISEGLESLRAIRQYCQVPVIVTLTQESGDRAVHDYLAAGATEFLYKPFRKSEIVSRARSVLRQGSVTETQAEVPFDAHVMEQEIKTQVAEQSTRLKQAFHDRISDEFREPLGRVTELSSVLATGVKTDETRAAIELVSEFLKATGRLLSSVDGMDSLPNTTTAKPSPGALNHRIDSHDSASGLPQGSRRLRHRKSRSPGESTDAHGAS